MKKTSTQSMAISTKKEGLKSSPRKSTIDFIKQFARSYNYNSQLHPSLGAFYAN